jgi:ankyrin repeat protein
MTAPQPSHKLPERPNLEHLKKQAKRLLAAYRQGDAEVVAEVTQCERNPDPASFALADAQRVLARTYGFASWKKLKEYLITGAIKRGDSKSLRALIAESSNPQAVLSDKVDGHHTAHASFGKGVTLLQLASFWENEDVAKTLLSLGATLDFHSACGLGDLETVARLLESDPSVIDKQVDTYYPLQFAITAGQVEVLRYLLEHGDDANRPIKKVCWFVWEDAAIAAEQASWKPIHMATLYSYSEPNIALAECLRDFGADLGAISPLDGYRAIHLAAMSGKVTILKFLVSSGVDVDSRTAALARPHAVELEDFSPLGGHDWTPLMIAAGEGHLATAEQLLKLGANVGARNSLGQTALHFAAAAFRGENLDIVKLLVARGANVTCRDNEGRQPVGMALRKGFTDTAQLLNRSVTGENSY